MKKVQVGFLLVGSLALSSCNSLIQKAADNTPVSVVPLAGKKMTGTMTASGATPLALKAQADFTVPLTTGPLTFGDFDPATLPSALQNPSGLDIPVSFSNLTLSCTPSASPLTMTLSNLQLTVSDAAHGSQSVSASTNTVLTLTKTASGYSVSSNTTMLKAKWSDFKTIVVKSGAETPNTATLTATVKLNDGAVGCLVTLNLASILQQYIRY